MIPRKSLSRALRVEWATPSTAPRSSLKTSSSLPHHWGTNWLPSWRSGTSEKRTHAVGSLGVVPEPLNILRASITGQGHLCCRFLLKCANRAWSCFPEHLQSSVCHGPGELLHTVSLPVSAIVESSLDLGIQLLVSEEQQEDPESR